MSFREISKQLSGAWFQYRILLCPNDILLLAKFDKNKFDNLKKLAAILRESRESKGLLLRQVAASIHVDTAMISKFEKGERKPTRDQIIGLATVLEIDKKVLLVSYLSDKITFDLKDEELAQEVLKVAEKKIASIQKNKK